ncbi:fetuin-B-like [Suncus etruscus]|uniref:fetuin-B-like n=1 Tax=Suncus etruscus TaxID=109475 RepID=UPI00210F6EDD|nr:fetuin-B-like [Suncus etruscus]
MGLLLPLVLCALASSLSARSPPQQVVAPRPPLLLSRGCNDSDVLSFADFALENINKDRTDGYILRLNRVSDAREQRQDDEPGGSLFYLTLDVLETSCHVLSRKSWKDCSERFLGGLVYGQCKALFYINRPRRVLHTVAYNCTLRPVSRRSVHMTCPDCPSPVPIDGSNPKVLEAATESLAKYNRESTSKKYSLVEVTQATSQGGFGSFYFVEYLIKESPPPCTKSMDSICVLPSDLPVGLCKGSLVEVHTKRTVTVSCDFFELQATAPGGENVAVQTPPPKLPKALETTQKKAELLDAVSKTEPKGTVKKLPDLDDERPEQLQDKSPQLRNQSPDEAFPVHLDLTNKPEGELLDVSFLFMGPLEEKLLILPFPSKEQRSAECPGVAQNENPLILPL